MWDSDKSGLLASQDRFIDFFPPPPPYTTVVLAHPPMRPSREEEPVDSEAGHGPTRDRQLRIRLLLLIVVAILALLAIVAISLQLILRHLHEPEDDQLISAPAQSSFTSHEDIIEIQLLREAPDTLEQKLEGKD